MDPKRKKIAAFCLVAIMLSALGIFLYDRYDDKPVDDDEGPSLPPYDMPPNIPVTTLNDDNNEPTIAAGYEIE